MRTLTALLFLLAALAISACGGDDGDDGDSVGKPRAVSADELADFAKDKDFPIYWAGEREDATYELTETAGGSVYVRYLVRDAEIGNKQPNFLTVGTYPRKNGFKELQKSSQKKGARSTPLEGGGLAVVNQGDTQSIYFAYPDSPVAVEVFHPAPGQAQRLVLDGEIKPVE